MGWSTTLALLILALALAAWVAVQNAWRRCFPAAASGDPDVLAGRSNCHGLTCAGSCAGRCPRTDCPNQEDPT